jgi:hypothetical protein
MLNERSRSYKKKKLQQVRKEKKAKARHRNVLDPEAEKNRQTKRHTQRIAKCNGGGTKAKGINEQSEKKKETREGTERRM